MSFSNAGKWKVKVKTLSRIRLLATPWTAAYQASPSMGFSRQEHWSGLPFPPPVHESEKWKWSHSVVSDPQRPHGPQPSRLLCPWDFPGKSTGVGCHCLLRILPIGFTKSGDKVYLNNALSFWNVCGWLFKERIVIMLFFFFNWNKIVQRSRVSGPVYK